MSSYNSIIKMLNAIKVASNTRNLYCTSKISVINLKILYIFYKNNLIKGYKINNNRILIYLKYKHETPLIKNIIFISKPSLKKNFKKKDFQKLYNKYNYLMVSNKYGINLLNRNQLNATNEGGIPLFAVIL